MGIAILPLSDRGNYSISVPSASISIDIITFGRNNYICIIVVHIRTQGTMSRKVTFIQRLERAAKSATMPMHTKEFNRCDAPSQDMCTTVHSAYIAPRANLATMPGGLRPLYSYCLADTGFCAYVLSGMNFISRKDLINLCVYM